MISTPAFLLAAGPTNHLQPTATRMRTDLRVPSVNCYTDGCAGSGRSRRSYCSAHYVDMSGVRRLAECGRLVGPGLDTVARPVAAHIYRGWSGSIQHSRLPPLGIGSGFERKIKNAVSICLGRCRLFSSVFIFDGVVK